VGPVIFHTTGGGLNGVFGFDDQIQLELRLPPGKYVVHARIELGNIDGDDQKASCGIRIRSSLAFIDRLDFVLSGEGAAYLALQGVCNIPLRQQIGDTIDLTAGTFNGFSDQTSLIAMSVGDIQPPVALSALKVRTKTRHKPTQVSRRSIVTR
jgi:hypothetical protein